MSLGKSTIFPSRGMSARFAAQQKNVSIGTIYRWIKQGKILAKKHKGRYVINNNKLFQQAQKYKRSGRKTKEVLRENLILKKQLRESQQQCESLHGLYCESQKQCKSLDALYRESLEHIAQLKQNHPPNYDFLDKSPDEVLWMFREYLRNRMNNPNSYSSELPKEPDYWDCPPDPNEPDWLYDENTRTIEIIPLKKTGGRK